MANIVIDPVIIMAPRDEAARAEVEAWLENLTTWLERSLTAPFTWLHDRQASELLEVHGQFPSFAQLKQLQQKYRLDVNSSHIARNVNEFFRDDTLDLEDHLKRLEYAIEPEDGSIIIKPEQFVARLPRYIDDGFYILLADCCACKHLDHPFGQKLHIATLALVDGSREIEVSVVVLYVLPLDFPRPVDNKIAQAFPLLITPDDLLPLTDVIDLWTKGESGIIYALKQESKKDRSGTLANLFKFRLGPHFIESVNGRGLDFNEIIPRSIIRAASNVIADRAKDIPGY